MQKLPQQAVYGPNPRIEVQPMIPPGVKTALDVGCGEGAFGGTLRTSMGRTARIVGIDAVPDNASAARRTGNYDEVLDGYFPDVVAANPEKFELITFLDVLEHMMDPWATLARTKDFLEDGGYVVAAIPNIRVWTFVRAVVTNGRWDYTDMGTLDRTHVRFFTRATMVEMFESAGFRVEACVGINSQRVSMKHFRAFFNRRIVVDFKWLPYLVPDTAWLQFVVVARKL